MQWTHQIRGKGSMMGRDCKEEKEREMLVLAPHYSVLGMRAASFISHCADVPPYTRSLFSHGFLSLSLSLFIWRLEGKSEPKFPSHRADVQAVITWKRRREERKIIHIHIPTGRLLLPSRQCDSTSKSEKKCKERENFTLLLFSTVASCSRILLDLFILFFTSLYSLPL